MGLESHAPVPFLDKATSSITPSPGCVGTGDALLHHCLLTGQNTVFIQGFGGEKEAKQAKVGTVRVPEYVLYATLGYLHAASRHNHRQDSKNALILSESCFGPPDPKGLC